MPRYGTGTAVPIAPREAGGDRAWLETPPLLAQVLLVFTDGLDDDAGMMKEVATSAWLQGGTAKRGKLGVTRHGVTPHSPPSPPDQADLLVTVAVNNSTGLGDLRQMEFGRWLGRGQQLAVDMPEAGGHVAQELVRTGRAGVGGGVPVGSEWGFRVSHSWPWQSGRAARCVPAPAWGCPVREVPAVPGGGR